MHEMAGGRSGGAAGAWRARLIRGAAAVILSVGASVGGTGFARAAAPAAATPAPSSLAQGVFDRMRGSLVQVHTLLKTQDSQSSVGSGFLVSEQGHLITNFHVVSDYALTPERYRIVYAGADGRQGALQLLAVDVVHDLALLRPVEAAAFEGRAVVGFRRTEPARGARIFSLGNPLDVGFAVIEGVYNGLAERSFVPTLFFGGSLSAGMSGGPAVDDAGNLVGVNVATRRDGQQVSFLVPGEFAQALLTRGRTAAPMKGPAYADIAQQLTAHQQALTQRFVGMPWRSPVPGGGAEAPAAAVPEAAPASAAAASGKAASAAAPDKAASAAAPDKASSAASAPSVSAASLQAYRIPVPQETFMRCWGSTQAGKGLQFERSDCVMDQRLFISRSLMTGFLTVRHEAYDGRKLGALRFAQRYSDSFTNEYFGQGDRQRTAMRCREDTVDRGGLPLRALVCVAAYKKLPGLYDLSVLTATLDQTTAGVQGRFDAYGVSYANAMLLTRHYLEGFAWTAPKTASR